MATLRRLSFSLNNMGINLTPKTSREKLAIVIASISVVLFLTLKIELSINQAINSAYKVLEQSTSDETWLKEQLRRQNTQNIKTNQNELAAPLSLKELSEMASTYGIKFTRVDRSETDHSFKVWFDSTDIHQLLLWINAMDNNQTATVNSLLINAANSDGQGSGHLLLSLKRH